MYSTRAVKTKSDEKRIKIIIFHLCVLYYINGSENINSCQIFKITETIPLAKSTHRIFAHNSNWWVSQVFTIITWRKYNVTSLLSVYCIFLNNFTHSWLVISFCLDRLLFIDVIVSSRLQEDHCFVFDPIRTVCDPAVAPLRGC